MLGILPTFIMRRHQLGSGPTYSVGTLGKEGANRRGGDEGGESIIGDDSSSSIYLVRNNDQVIPSRFDDATQAMLLSRRIMHQQGGVEDEVGSKCSQGRAAGAASLDSKALPARAPAMEIKSSSDNNASGQHSRTTGASRRDATASPSAQGAETGRGGKQERSRTPPRVGSMSLGVEHADQNSNRSGQRGPMQEAAERLASMNAMIMGNGAESISGSAYPQRNMVLEGGNASELSDGITPYERVALLEASRRQQLLRMQAAMGRTMGLFEQGSMLGQPAYNLGGGAAGRASFHDAVLASRLNTLAAARAAAGLAASQFGGMHQRFSHISGTSVAFPGDRSDMLGVDARDMMMRSGLFPPSSLSSIGPTQSNLPEDERAALPDHSNSAARDALQGSMNSSCAGPFQQGGLDDEAFKIGHSKGESTAAERRLGIKRGPYAKTVVKRKPGNRDRRFNSSTPISLVASARSETTVSLDLTGRKPILMFLDMDSKNLSPYQCYLRQQIELFEANAEDLQYNAQKMNKAVVLGQVGIRCRHCSHEDPWTRTRGAVYYSASLGGLYQAGQNMGKNHLDSNCTSIPVEIRNKLLKLKENKRRAGGGKTYWADSARYLGIFEDQYGLRFSKEVPEEANHVPPGNDEVDNRTAMNQAPPSQDAVLDPSSSKVSKDYDDSMKCDQSNDSSSSGQD